MAGSAPNRRAHVPEPLDGVAFCDLQELNRARAFGTPLDEALGIITAMAHDLLGVSLVALVLQRPGDPFEIASWHGIDPFLSPVHPIDVALRLLDQHDAASVLQENSSAQLVELAWGAGAGAAIIVGRQTRGALVALREPGRGGFDGQQLCLLDSLACSARTALRNADLLEAERRKTQETKALGTISKVLAGTLDLDPVLEAIGDQVLTLLPVDRCLIWLLDESRDWITALYVGGMDQQQEQEAHRMFRRRPPDLINESGFMNGRTVVADRACDSLMRPDIITRYSVKSLMLAPLVGRERVFGGIYVDCSREFHHWTERERCLVEALAEEAAVAIQATQLYQAQKVEAETSGALLQVATALGRYNKLDDVMRTVVEITPKLMSSDHCSAWLWDPEQDEFRPLQSWGLAERIIPAFQALRFKAGEAPYTREILEKRAPVIVNDVPESGLIPRYIVDVLSIKSLLAVPLLSKGEVVGALNIIHTRSPHRFEPHEITIAQGIANLAGLAMENARLSEQAVKVEALRRLDQMKTEFLANVSHELRTPLTAIKGLTSTLLQDDVQWDKESERDFLQTVADEADRLEKMVEELLDLSRMEAGIFRVHREECDVARVIMRVTTLMRPHMNGREIDVCLSPRLRHAWADERRVGQVLANLLENAHKYSPSGLPVMIRGKNQNGLVQVSVADHGLGIPEQDLEHVFERFFQHPSHDSTTEGAGLGLAICRGIVEAHGGTIWAKSLPGKGTTFTFTLPSASPRREEAS